MVRGANLLLFAALTAGVDAAPVSVGAAKVDVTPKEPVVLAGYGGRSKVFEGIDSKLWARALVIGDGEPVAIVALDNCGVPAAVTARVAARLRERGIAPERLVVAATHTHNAPNLVGYAPIVWAGRTTPEQDRKSVDYTDYAVEKMAAAVTMALDARMPMHLEWAQGRVTFGGNRRVLRDGKWAGFGFQRTGPVDHSLPVLAARDADGEVRAVWANYACHCTTVGSRNHVGGDWAGYANESMEMQFGGAVALMTIGCGADVGPQPGGSLQLADQHGRSIGAEVRRLLSGSTVRLDAAPTVVSERIQLPLAEPAPRAHWEKQLGAGGFHRELAKAMLHQLDTSGSIPSMVDYPLSAWKFGDDLAMVFLPGEVVVDYSVRLSRELDWSKLWLTAWANAMPGYIPSKRVLQEGGYEPDFSQVYYQQPGRYEPEVEEVVVQGVRGLLGGSFEARTDQKPAPFHRGPSGESMAFERLARWVGSDLGDEEILVLERLREWVPKARPAIGRMTKSGEDTDWHNFAGDFVKRTFIRQQEEGSELAWLSPELGVEPGERAVLCFTGGVGWESEPETGGFALCVGGDEVLRFDVTRGAARWISKDRRVELAYLPTWRSGLDSGGFFFIVLAPSRLGTEGSVGFSVRSLGHGSKRWFAVDTEQDLAGRLKKLAAVLH